MPNNISFTSVIPVKVIANGVEATDAETVRKTCNYLIRSLSGPVKYNPNPVVKNAAARLSTMDPDYDFFRAYTHGYLGMGEDIINSDFFKTIIGKHGGYIVTGSDVNQFKLLGHEIGRARKICKESGVKCNERLMQAHKNYQNYIYEIGTSVSRRIKEIFNPQTREKIGKPQQMEVHITTRIAKRKGVNKVEIKSLDNIDFTDRLNFTKTS